MSASPPTPGLPASDLPASDLRVTALTLYPVKGLRGISVQGRSVGPMGLDGDRRWMVVDAEGTFLSQRSHPAMALVGTAFVDAGGVGATSDPRGRASLRLRLTSEGRAPVEVPADPTSAEPGGAPPPESGIDTLSATIWGHPFEALAPSPEADAWLSDFLGEPVRLVYQPDAAVRPTDPTFAPGHRVSLADGYPVLVISEASLAELNRRLPEPVSMARFRPNVVVAGPCAPHAEDRWRRLRIGAVAMAGVKRCARCSVTTVDPATAERGLEPLKTLATYRAEAGKVWFGQNLVPEPTRNPGVVQVGDPVVVTEEGPVGP
jgi:uncharacterized protein